MIRKAEAFMSEPLISVILPVYNIEHFLPQCMDSLFVQTYKNIEMIIVDDGSGEKCSELCDTYGNMDGRVKVFHKENGGLSDARNFGIMKAKGEYITCIDPDDYVDRDYIEYLYSLIEAFKTRMSICQHRVVFNNHTADYGSENEPELLSAERCIERMLYHDVVDTSAWAKLYHRSLFDNVDYPVGRIYEDVATTYKLMVCSGTIAVGYQSKYSYCLRNDSIVNDSFSLRKLDLLDMTDAMAEDVNRIFPDLCKATMRRRVYARFSTLNQMIGIDDVSDQRREIISFIKDNSKGMLFDPKVPGRDKAALILLKMGYPLYERVWIKYISKR